MRTTQEPAAPTVIVVEDDAQLRSQVAELLQEAGFTVASFGGADAALSALLVGHVRPDVVVLDLMMPGVNGWDFADRLSERPELKNIPIVVITAAREHWGYPERAFKVVRKPFDADVLIDAVRAAIASARRPFT